MQAAARTANAMMVRVGFFSGNVVKQLPSTTNRFLTVVGLAIPIQNRTARIIPHADRPSLVTRETGRFRVVVNKHAAFRRVQNLLGVLLHIFPYRAVVLAKAKMNNRIRNAVVVGVGGIRGDPVLRSAQHLPKAIHPDKTGLKEAHLPFEGIAEAVAIMRMKWVHKDMSWS